MIEKKETAITWLENELKVRPKPIYNSDIDKLFEQAKAMEREQIEEAYSEAERDLFRGNRNEPCKYHNASDYFTKKYQNGENS